jgi:hypothetical protein
MKTDDASVKEPLWKTVLNWGTVITFFTLPAFLITVQIYSHTHPDWWQHTPQEQDRFHYLNDFLRNVTLLVFGLAGLRTWEQIKNGNRKEKHDDKTNDN